MTEKGRCRMEKKNKGVWNKLTDIRANKGFNVLDLMETTFDSFFELHGDRYYYDDKAIIGGLAYLQNKPVTVIGLYRGRDSKEHKMRNYGMPLPEGYRKALRLMKQAEKFNRPVICFIDTPGAYPGIEAEERGQAEAIARNLYEMSLLKIPVISIITGEGGSGGALALAVSNQLLMLENAVFSVISPEGCASILWHDAKLAPKAAENLKIEARDLVELHIADQIIAEEKDLKKMGTTIKNILIHMLREYEQFSGDELAHMKYGKYRKIGSLRN